ncbi:MAG: hypothetical protein H7141_04195 [Burkholderiales bacterium]|nr:hypothetical protein [Bacteroidia bacterium]
MVKKAETMDEFYSDQRVNVQDFINDFNKAVFEYFYENVILKMDQAPVVKFDSYEIELDETYEYGMDATGRVYKLEHEFEEITITLEYTFNLDYRKVCNMYMNFSVGEYGDFIDVNLDDSEDMEYACTELFKRLRNGKLKILLST